MQAKPEKESIWMTLVIFTTILIIVGNLTANFGGVLLFFFIMTL